MKILGKVAFLLLLGGIWCQNNRNAKATGKSTKKSAGNQGGDVGQPAPVADLTPGSTRGTGGTGSSRGTGSTGNSRGTAGTGGTGGTGSTRGTAEAAEAGQEGAAGAQEAGEQTDDMRLHFLKNTQVTCNDGTAAG